MAEFVYNELGLRSAATIHDGSPYAEQLQQVFADVFAELGGTITAQEAVNVGDTDMRPVLTSIATGAPDIIYYPIFIAEGGFCHYPSQRDFRLGEHRFGRSGWHDLPLTSSLRRVKRLRECTSVDRTWLSPGASMKPSWLLTKMLMVKPR